MKPTLLREPIPLRQRVEPAAKRKRILVIAGPTAAGKTQLSLSLAAVLGGEILSADSTQVYKGMDIGTAKASPEDRATIAHHLIDICDVDKPFNVVEFYEAAYRAFREIIVRDNVPIVVGGSGFYIHVLLYGPPLGPPASPDVRRQLERQMKNLGAEVLYERLQILDPLYAKNISEKDKHKIIRALEIIALSEKKVSDFPVHTLPQEREYDFRCWFLYYQKKTLYARIDSRCDEMLHKGFLREVQELDAQGIRKNPCAAQAIGYRQALAFLDSPQREEDFSRFVMHFKRATRHFAKRQFTWFRKEPLFRWLDVEKHPMEKIKELILQDFEFGL